MRNAIAIALEIARQSFDEDMWGSVMTREPLADRLASYKTISKLHTDFRFKRLIVSAKCAAPPSARSVEAVRLYQLLLAPRDCLDDVCSPSRSTVVMTMYPTPQRAIASAVFSGSCGSSGGGVFEVFTAQKRHPRVQVSPISCTTRGVRVDTVRA